MQGFNTSTNLSASQSSSGRVEPIRGNGITSYEHRSEGSQIFRRRSYFWIEQGETIHIKAASSFGDPVELTEKEAKKFSPGEASFMINYRVDDLLGMVANLKKAGIQILEGPDSSEFGKFASILDPEGNKIELWEP